MAGSIGAIKTLIVPAVISLVLFLVSTFVIVPVWRRARDRYGQYIPLETISNQTLSFWERLSRGLTAMMARPFWRRDSSQRVVDGGGGGGSRSDDDDGLSDDGEELASVHPGTRRALAENARNHPDRSDSTRRLSRDLEEGFRDDSDDEDDRRNNGR